MDWSWMDKSRFTLHLFKNQGRPVSVKDISCIPLHVPEKRSDVNKDNKKKQKWYHCAGTRSLANIRKVEFDKSGVQMDRTYVFIVTHTRKDGRPMNEACGAIILLQGMTVMPKFLVKINQDEFGEWEHDPLQHLCGGVGMINCWLKIIG